MAGQSYTAGPRLASRRRGHRPPQRKRRTELALNMAPMIDMTFLLFSFVLVTSNFERPEGLLASQLPKNAGAPAIALPFSPIVVRLTQAGPSENDVEIRVDRFAESPRHPDELVGLLLEIHSQPGFDKDTPVILVADDEVRWDHVVNAWNAALRAGCRRVAFGGR